MSLPEHYPEVVWSTYGAHRIEKVTPKRVFVRRGSLGYLSIRDPGGPTEETLLRIVREEFDDALNGKNGGCVRATGGHPDRLNVFSPDERRGPDAHWRGVLGLAEQPDNVGVARLAAQIRMAEAESDEEREVIRDAYYSCIGVIGMDGLSGDSIALDGRDAQRIRDLAHRESSREVSAQVNARQAMFAVHRLIGDVNALAYCLSFVIHDRAWESCGFDSMGEWVAGDAWSSGLGMTPERLDALLQLQERAVELGVVHKHQEVANVLKAVAAVRSELGFQDAQRSTIAGRVDA